MHINRTYTILAFLIGEKEIEIKFKLQFFSGLPIESHNYTRIKDLTTDCYKTDILTLRNFESKNKGTKKT